MYIYTQDISADLRPFKELTQLCLIFIHSFINTFIHRRWLQPNAKQKLNNTVIKKQNMNKSVGDTMTQ